MLNLKFKPLLELPKYHKKRFEFQTASVLHTIQNFLHLQVVIVGNGAVGKSSMIQHVFTRFSKFLLWFKLLPFPARGFISAVNKYNVVNWQKKKYWSFNILHLQVVIVGNGAVGKSSMIQRYCRGIFTNSYKKTIGVDFLEKQLR